MGLDRVCGLEKNTGPFGVKHSSAKSEILKPLIKGNAVNFVQVIWCEEKVLRIYRRRRRQHFLVVVIKIRHSRDMSKHPSHTRLTAAQATVRARVLMSQVKNCCGCLCRSPVGFYTLVGNGSSALMLLISNLHHIFTLYLDAQDVVLFIFLLDFGICF